MYVSQFVHFPFVIPILFLLALLLIYPLVCLCFDLAYSIPVPLLCRSPSHLTSFDKVHKHLYKTLQRRLPTNEVRCIEGELSVRIVTQRKGTALESPVAQTIARQDLNCSSATDGENVEMPNFSTLS